MRTPFKKTLSLSNISFKMGKGFRHYKKQKHFRGAYIENSYPEETGEKILLSD